MALPKILRTYSILVRPRIEKMSGWVWFSLIGALVAGHGFPPILPVVLLIISVWAIASCVYIYNDVVDLEMDRLNPLKFDRPLPSGKVSIKEAMNIVYITGFIGIGLSFFINLQTLLLCVALMALLLAYSNPHIRLKKRFLLKEGSLSIGMFLAPFIGNMTVGSISLATIFAGVFGSFCAITFQPAFMDEPDIDEDRKYGIKTLASILAWKTKIEIGIIFVLVVMTLTPLTYVQLGLNVVFPIMVVALCLLVLRFLFPLLSGFEQTIYRRAHSSIYAFYILVPVGLILGSL